MPDMLTRAKVGRCWFCFEGMYQDKSNILEGLCEQKEECIIQALELIIFKISFFITG